MITILLPSPQRSAMPLVNIYNTRVSRTIVCAIQIVGNKKEKKANNTILYPPLTKLPLKLPTKGMHYTHSSKKTSPICTPQQEMLMATCSSHQILCSWLAFPNKTLQNLPRL